MVITESPYYDWCSMEPQPLIQFTSSCYIQVTHIGFCRFHFLVMSLQRTTNFTTSFSFTAFNRFNNFTNFHQVQLNLNGGNINGGLKPESVTNWSPIWPISTRSSCNCMGEMVGEYMKWWYWDHWNRWDRVKLVVRWIKLFGVGHVSSDFLYFPFLPYAGK